MSDVFVNSEHGFCSGNRIYPQVIIDGKLFI